MSGMGFALPLLAVALCAIAMSARAQENAPDHAACYFQTLPDGVRAPTQAEAYAVDRLLAGYYLLPTGWRRACGASPDEMRAGFAGIWRGVGCSPDSDAWQSQIQLVDKYANADSENITVTGCDIEQELTPEWPAFCAAVRAYPYGADPSVGDVFEPLREAADALTRRANQQGCFD